MHYIVCATLPMRIRNKIYVIYRLEFRFRNSIQVLSAICHITLAFYAIIRSDSHGALHFHVQLI